MSFTYQKAALGGTFDNLHKGHQALLDKALATAQRVVIGLTTPQLTQHKAEAQRIQSYPERLTALEAFLKAKRAADRAHIVPLENIYGTTLTDPEIDCLVVSEQTKPGAEQINQQRLQLHKLKLPVIVAPMQVDQLGHYISSTRIRAGEISSTGQVYRLLFTTNRQPTPSQRRFIHTIHGQLVSQLAVDQVADWLQPTVLVGDYVTDWWLNRQLPFTHAIIDGNNGQQPFLSQSLQQLDWLKLTTANPQGHIQAQAVSQIVQLMNQEQGLLVVDGEEDLLAVPAYCFLPLGSKLIYGQHKQGMVILEATDQFKQEVANMLTSEPTHA